MKLIHKHPLISLLILTCLIHGLSLFVSGVFWDGVILHSLYADANSTQLYSWLRSMGLPFDYYFTRFLWIFGYSWVCNLVGFLGIYTVAVFYYKSICLYKRMSKQLAFMSATVLIVWPGSLLTMFRAVTVYYFLYGLFFIAVYVALKLECIPHRKITYCFMRLFSLCLFWISFNLKSLLCLYLLVFIAMFILYAEQNKKKLFSFLTITKFSLSRLDFLLLPILFWLVSILFYKTSGPYAGYNKLDFSNLNQTLNLIHASFKHAILQYLWPFIVLSIILIVCGFNKWESRFALKNLKIGLFVTGFGMLAIFCCIVPYVLVGKPLIYSFIPASRCSLLIPSCVAILMIGFGSVFFITPQGALNYVGKTILTLLILWGIVFWTENYLTLNAWAAMQRAFVLKLEKNPQWAPYSLYWIKVNDFAIPPAYADYAYAGYFSSAYGGTSRFGESDASVQAMPFESYFHAFTEPSWRIHFNVSEFDPYGCQAKMTIMPGKLAGNPRSAHRIGLSYLYYRYLKPEDEQYYLDNLIRIQVKPKFSEHAKHCTA